MNLSEMTEEQLRAIIRQEITQDKLMSAGEADALRKRIDDRVFKLIRQSFRFPKQLLHEASK